MILSAEGRLEDSARRESLMSRTIESLNDKLEDIKADERSSISNREDVTVEDAGTVVDEDTAEEASIFTDKIEDNAESGDLLVEDIRDEYKRLFLTEGSKKARDYLKDLKDNNKLPKNFTFN